MYFKVFKYLSHVPRMDSILVTVSSCAFDLFLFFIMFSIIMFGFTAAFYIVFGPYMEDYRSLSSAFGTLIRILLGDFDYQSMDAVDGTMAPLLFYTFIFVGFMLLMNMFLAIVCDSFAEVKDGQSEEDLNFYINLKNKLSAQARLLFSSRKELNKITAELKGADTNLDNLIDEGELEAALANNPRAYELLKSTGAKDLLAKYDVDGNGVLDPAEMTKVLKELAEKESEIMAEISANEAAAADTSSKIKSAEGMAMGGVVAANVDLSEVEARLDKVEGQIKEMSRNVAKKLALMIDLMMSLSDQISNVNAMPTAGHPSQSQIVPVSHPQGSFGP